MKMLLPTMNLSSISLLLLLCSVMPLICNGQGTTNFVFLTSPPSDYIFTNTPPATQTLINQVYHRMIVYVPFWNSRSTWYPKGWMYLDTYSIFDNEATELDQYILRDAGGNRLYIPWSCNGVSCPQYAADISSPQWRSRWISDAQQRLTQGNFKGIFMDDVSLDSIKTCNGNGEPVVPMDPNTNQPMTYTNWKRYFVEFLEQVRVAFPKNGNYELVHNAVWTAGLTGVPDPEGYIVRQQMAADFINKQNGVSDDLDFTGGIGPFQYSLSAFLDYVDSIHNRGLGIVLEHFVDDPVRREYELAAYFLVSNGADAIANPFVYPADFWTPYTLNLGNPLNARSRSAAGLFRRDFVNGIILLNEPGAPEITVQLGEQVETATGDAIITSVTLSARSGAVLRRLTPASSSSTTSESTTTSPTTTPTTTSTKTDTSPGTTTTTGCPNPPALPNLVEVLVSLPDTSLTNGISGFLQGLAAVLGISQSAFPVVQISGEQPEAGRTQISFSIGAYECVNPTESVNLLRELTRSNDPILAQNGLEGLKIVGDEVSMASPRYHHGIATTLVLIGLLVWIV